MFTEFEDTGSETREQRTHPLSMMILALFLFVIKLALFKCRWPYIVELKSGTWQLDENSRYTVLEKWRFVSSFDNQLETKRMSHLSLAVHRLVGQDFK